MQRADVTDSVWDAVLAARAGRRAAPDPDWPAAARAAWSLYAPLALSRRGGSYLFAQVGQSLDGRIATVSGDARDVSSRDGLCHLHRCRALADAVIVGVRTAVSDDPRLTVRLVRGVNPARVVIDPKGRLPDDAAMLEPDGARRIVIQASDTRRPAGVEVITLPASGDWISPILIRKVLAAHGLNRLLVEGGGITIAGFLEAGLLQRLHVCVAPLIIGAGPAGLRTSPVARLADALRPEMHVYGLENDVVFDCALDQGGVASRSVWPTTQAAEVVAAKRA